MFDPLDFIANLAALVPRPRTNLTRFHGVLAPNNWYRESVTPLSDKGVIRGCRFGNDLPINDSHPDVRVNLIEFREVSVKGKTSQWSWISSLPITRENTFEIATIGRSRWRIEN